MILADIGFQTQGCRQKRRARERSGPQADYRDSDGGGGGGGEGRGVLRRVGGRKRFD